MSLPQIPEMPSIPRISPCDAISFILASIAFEEIGLSHIINAEGEKIQAVVKAFECDKAKVCDVLAVDKSVSNTLRSVVKKEILLELKMLEAFEALESLPQCKASEHCSPGHREN